MSPILLFTGNSNVVHPPVASGACRSSLQGVTADVHGYLLMHWATIWERIGYVHSTPSWRGCRVTGTTPDFMLEHFIVVISTGTS